MHEYPKIENLFTRSLETNKPIWRDFRSETVKALQNIKWTFVEKLDGMNIRVKYLVDRVEFAGKTDMAILPLRLVEHLKSVFPLKVLNAVFKHTPVCIYGEGVGEKIQSGGYYCPGENQFVMFDVFNVTHNDWVPREHVEQYAKQMAVPLAPVLFKRSIQGFLSDISERVFRIYDNETRIHYQAKMAEQYAVDSPCFFDKVGAPPRYVPEGYIVRPYIPQNELRDTYGKRIECKIKWKDLITCHR